MLIKGKMSYLMYTVLSSEYVHNDRLENFVVDINKQFCPDEYSHWADINRQRLDVDSILKVQTAQSNLNIGFSMIVWHRY